MLCLLPAAQPPIPSPGPFSTHPYTWSALSGSPAFRTKRREAVEIQSLTTILLQREEEGLYRVFRRLRWWTGEGE